MSFAHRWLRRHYFVIALLCFSAVTTAQAQSANNGRAMPGAAVAIVGPPPPEAPEVITRDDSGHATVRAIRLQTPLRLDGSLDEEVYQTTAPIGGLIQQEPHEGDRATEQTDVWIFFDDRNIYIGARCWDSHPERILANELRRDNVNIFNNDSVTVAFDTFYDHRSGFFFQTNPLSAIRDGSITNEQPNFDWNAVWDTRSRRFNQGWTTEMVIPFKSLRYREGGQQVWGFNFRRTIRWKNETVHITRVPASGGVAGLFRLSVAATLVGLEMPSTSRNLELKPSAVSDLTTNHEAAPPTSNELDGSFGFDAKYGLTRSLIVDFTYNTDFAQVEADDQQVNLTRFSLRFPEKREFFLEGQGIFAFGGVGSETPVLFFSRQIGLSNGQTVPIRAGGRLTGRAGKYSVGLLNIETGDSQLAKAVATNFTVARVKRDILRKSAIGFMSTTRAPTTAGAETNLAAGVDAKLKFFQDLEINTYYARTRTPNLQGDTSSYQAQFLLLPDRYGVSAERLKIGDAFDPQVGFLLRTNFTRDDVLARFSPRPKSLKGIRKITWQGEGERFTGGDGRRETENGIGTFGLTLENGDTANLVYTSEYEYLRSPFRIAPGVVLPVGGYAFQQIQASYGLGIQRKRNGTFTVTHGSFYNGDREAVDYSGRLQLHPRLSVEPRLSLNWVDLPQGKFTTTLVSARPTYTISPRALIGALVQYNSSLNSLTTNIRFRWEYQPGSDVFVVYSEGRNTALVDTSNLANRGVAIKFTRLFRY